MDGWMDEWKRGGRPLVGRSMIVLIANVFSVNVLRSHAQTTQTIYNFAPLLLSLSFCSFISNKRPHFFIIIII